MGVSESIISGMPMKLGTGFFDLLHKADVQSDEDTTICYPKLLFEDSDLHTQFNYEVDSRFSPGSEMVT